MDADIVPFFLAIPARYASSRLPSNLQRNE
jgi:CMP-2-keto-3-deoxyoctulosonic acid synthetase